MSYRVDRSRQFAASSLAEHMSRTDPFKHVDVPPYVDRVKILGIYYLHTRQDDGGDLYVTRFGLPYLEHLKLSNWHEEGWFKVHREKLKGTSTVYKVPSKVVNGRSINLVVKWCRVGTEVPLDTMTFNRFSDAEFNSPFEEFSLLMEMRERARGPRILTHKPLGIYVPPEQLKLWQTGRSKSRIDRKKSKHRDVELDILRQYILIYEWIKGESADFALDNIISDPETRKEEIYRLTTRARRDMEQKGFHVIDHKPAHVILRQKRDRTILKRRNGDVPYALVDFELLIRTTSYEKEVENIRRSKYLELQRSKFDLSKNSPLPEHLKCTGIYGVDYVWGYTESTHGMLWVVGRNAELFDYFLPERWRHTQRKLLSDTAETYHTVSKDHVSLVWKVSRVGETPEPSSSYPYVENIMEHGYNSPFEEFAIAMELSRQGISIIYPRAIYRAGLESPRARDYVTDLGRFKSHADIQTPDGLPVLSKGHNYITLWGFWQGRIDDSEDDTEAPCTGMDLSTALRERLISKPEQSRLIELAHEKIKDAGFMPFLKPSHLLLSIEADGSFRRDAATGLPVVTICNFELLKRI